LRSRSLSPSLGVSSLYRLHTTPSPQVKSSPAGYNFQSPGGTAKSFTDHALCMELMESLVPEICLDHIWFESGNIPRLVAFLCLSISSETDASDNCYASTNPIDGTECVLFCCCSFVCVCVCMAVRLFLVEVCAGPEFRSHPRPFPHPLHPLPPAPIHFVIHPHPSVYQFLSIPPIPVDVVFSHCPVGHSLELY